MHKSKWRPKECAVCGAVAATERRSVLDKEIRPYCKQCRRENAEPMDLLKAALVARTWDEVSEGTRAAVRLLHDGSYISALEWAKQHQEKLISKAVARALKGRCRPARLKRMQPTDDPLDQVSARNLVERANFVLRDRRDTFDNPPAKPRSITTFISEIISFVRDRIHA